MEKNNILVIDNFFANPDLIRRNVLKSKFQPNTNSQFSSKKLGLNENFKMSFRKQVCKHIGNEYMNRFIDSEFCLYTKEDEIKNKKKGIWIHSDRCSYIGIVFLTPRSNTSIGGLSFYQHIDSGFFNWYQLKNEYEMQKVIVTDSTDLSKWNNYTYIRYKFNRLVLFNSFYFHQANSYFGSNILDGRITLNIFFN